MEWSGAPTKAWAFWSISFREMSGIVSGMKVSVPVSHLIAMNSAISLPVFRRFGKNAASPGSWGNF